MENTYARLEDCIMRFFSTATQPGAFTDDDNSLFIVALRECNEAYRKKVVCYAFSGANRKQIGLFIQQIQHQLLLLAEKIEKSIQSIGPFKNATTSYKYSLAYVTELIEQQISFLEENFPQYLNMHEKIPAGYKKLLQRELEPRLKFIKSAMVKANYDQELLRLLLDPAENLLKDLNSTCFTFHQMAFVKHFYKQLLIHFKSKNVDHTFFVIMQLVVELNFNTTSFLHYAIQQVSLSINGQPSHKAQLEKLYWWQKEIGQMYQSNTDAFISQMPGAKQSLLLWLKEEIKYQEKLQQLSLVMPPNKEDLPHAATLLTTLSVEQLSCFLKVLFDKKIIYHPNMQEMINFFASNIRTKNTNRVSNKSLRNNSYGISENVIEDIVAMLISLVNHTRTLDKNN